MSHGTLGPSGALPQARREQQLRRPPVKDKEWAHLSHIPREQRLQHVLHTPVSKALKLLSWKSSNMCGPKDSYVTRGLCFFHAHVHSRITTDREVFEPCTCRLPSSPPIVKCYFHLRVNSRITSHREKWSSLMCHLLPRPSLVEYYHHIHACPYHRIYASDRDVFFPCPCSLSIHHRS